MVEPAAKEGTDDDAHDFNFDFGAAYTEGLIDRAPKWGDERDPPEMWIRRQDEYEDAGARADA